MIKYLLPVAFLLSAAPASAQSIDLNLDRMNVITEAAYRICRQSMDGPSGQAAKILERESGYLNLSKDEKLYLLSLCVLYGQGRIDSLKAR